MEKIFDKLSFDMIITYFIIGYMFLHIMKFIAKKRKNKEPKDTWIKSIVVGYVLIELYDRIIGNKYDFVSMFFYSLFILICVYFIGLFCNSTYMRNILRFLKISSVYDETVWSYLRDRDYPVWVKLRNTDKRIQIYGMWEYTEGTENKPVITLGRYAIYDLRDNVIVDYNNDLTRKCLIDTSQYD